MASGWLAGLQQQMKVAENLLNAVDEVVMKKVGATGEKDGQGSLSSRPSNEPQEGEVPPLPTSKRASFSDAQDGNPNGSMGGFVHAAGGSPFGATTPGPADRQLSAANRLLLGQQELSSPAPPAAASKQVSSSSVAVAPHAEDLSPAAQPQSRGSSGSGSMGTPAPGLLNGSTPSKQSTSGLPQPAPSASQPDAPQPFHSANTSSSGSKASAANAPPTPPTHSGPLPLPASMSVSMSSSSELLSSKDHAAGGGDGQHAAAASSTSGVAPSGREAHLSRLVEQLKDKLRHSKLENEQLEDMLAQAEARCERERALVVSLRAEVAAASDSHAAREAALNNQLATQAASLQELGSRCEGLSRQVVVLEGELAVARESSRSLMQNKADLEGGMLDALRAQLAAAESQLDAERRAHSATRAAAVSREGELEALLTSNGAALADMQRRVQENAQRVREAEDALAVAVARNQELQQQAGGGGPPGSSTASERLAALQEEVQQLHAELEVQSRSLQQSESARLAAVGEAQTLRSELAAMRAELEAGARLKDTAQLEAQLREAHELLYQKQAHIERLSADRAALQLRLEREVAAASNRAAAHQQAADPHTTLHVGRPSDNRSLASSTEHTVVPTGSALGERYRHLASQPDKLGRTLAASATLLDRTTALVVQLLRQYPLVRLATLAYLLLLHLYIYVLTLRMQHAFEDIEGEGRKGPGGLPHGR